MCFQTRHSGLASGIIPLLAFYTFPVFIPLHPIFSRFRILLLVFLAGLGTIACRKKGNPTPQLVSGKAFVVPSDSVVEVFKSKPVPPWAPKQFDYKPSRERKWDLIHTRLEVSFDWEKQQMPGIADLTLEPYFYPQKELELDAKGFEIYAIDVTRKNLPLASSHTYDGKKLRVLLEKEIVKGESIQVRIRYRAKPNDLPEGGGVAITKDKGLFFINADGKEKEMPQQIWTQGEPESSSCWFPTIDSPNERCTQEMHITVADKFKTLSNGVLLYSKKEKDGNRTDVWEMKKPHAPYLFMMAVGEFAVVEDACGEIPLHYWVEPKYQPTAKKIFGRTPAMINFFSKKLGYPFPWPKYDQVVVREFVSGAMENTTASVFMESLQSGPRELVDRDWDDIIAHELFHQWFGDLVTIESWANLPLNESFANYSQFLWDEHRHGTDEADLNAFKEKSQYLFEASRKREPMIRFLHNKAEDMFDSHSYAKGGRILHMLRKELGEEAFFGGLKLYLTKHAFQSVEIHHLRMAFEEISGRDLNWFFNQWFMEAGHPELVVKIQNENDRLRIYTRQVQDTAYFPLYKLHVPVEIWTKTGCETKILEIGSLIDTFSFPMPEAPRLVLWDANASLLAQTEINMGRQQWIAQYHLASRAIHRLEALNHLKSEFSDFPDVKEVFAEAIGDPFWANRQFALEALLDLDSGIQNKELARITACATSDPKPFVRTQALKLLANLRFDGKKELLEKAMADSSISASTQAYKVYLKEDYPDAPEKIAALQSLEDLNYAGVLAEYFASRPGKTSFDWFTASLKKQGNLDNYELIQGFGRMLQQVSDSALVKKGLDQLFQMAMDGKKAEVVIGSFQVLKYFQAWPGVKSMRTRIKEAHKSADFGEVLDYLE